MCIFVTACCNHRNEQWLRLLRWSRCVSLHHSISESIRLKQKPKKLLVISTCSVQIMHPGSDEKTHFSLLMDYCLVFICIWAAVLLLEFLLRMIFCFCLLCLPETWGCDTNKFEQNLTSYITSQLQGSVWNQRKSRRDSMKNSWRLLRQQLL